MPAGEDSLPPAWSLRVNGTTLPPDAERDLVSIRVEEDLDALAMATITLTNWDPDSLRHTWSDDRLFSVGASIALSMGHIETTWPVFAGEVTGIEPVWSPDRAPTVTIRAYDLGHRLTRSTATQTFLRMKDSAIASKVATGAGLRPVVTDTKVLVPYVLQSNQTHLDFLRSRARRYGYELFVRDKTLHFRPPDVDARPSLRLAVGEDLEEFAAWLSATGEPGATTVRGWDVKAKASVVGSFAAGQLPTAGGTLGVRTADKAFGRSTSTTATVPVASKAEADAMAGGRLGTSALRYVEAESEGPGRPRLRIGATVGIDGAGSTFSGTYYVAQVSHAMSDGQFRTSTRLRRSAT